MELKLKSDTKKRKQLLTALHFSHPAKMHIGLQEWLLHEYTKPGDIILDPMAGSGTMLIGTLMGRNVVCVELEEKFCQMQRDNLEKLNEMPLYLGTQQRGWAEIIQGDARELGNILCDAVISSPPYEGVESRDRSQDAYIEQPHSGGIVNYMYGYNAGNAGNIGNLKGSTYLEAMLIVYQNCHAVLKLGGLMILVTKDFIRDKKRIDLAGDTIKLCEQAGFELTERHYRRLMSQSFWRTIYHQKYPEVEPILNEDILIFKKGTN